ncbi:MAG TPA: hypothetical protein PLA94_25235 [Myxococcota bacterium]|nr:hypothetical protein [Myxococcota bacterium]
MSIRLQTWPYRVAERTRVRPEPWNLLFQSGPRPLGESLDHWDPSTDLLLRRKFRVDVDGLRADCRLPPQAELRLVATWHSLGTTLRSVGERTVLPTSGAYSGQVSLSIPADQLGGDLRLKLTICLATALPSRPVTAFRAGSVLWEDEREVRLEGGSSRFPMEDISFSEAGWQFPVGAAWRLIWEEEDLELPFLGSVRLYLNRDHAMIRELIEQPEQRTSRIVASLLQFEVARSLLKGALASENYRARKEPWPEDSVGKVVERLLKAHFKDQSPEGLRTLQAKQPDQWESLLQARLGLLVGV